MSYQKNALFIDTNIYLEFYKYSDSDLNSLEQLSDSLEKEHFELLVNQQLKDEFSKNRASRINQAFQEYKKINYNLPIPTLFSNEIECLKDLHAAKKNYEKAYATLLSKIQKGVLDETLKADLIINKIFQRSKHIKIDNDIYNKAIRRMRCHNPPGEANELGDALHWESLLSHVETGKNLIIISNDSDFIDDLLHNS
jgi:predicted nucleic acid-binding protein